jgi:hypothetical protein
MTTRRWMIAVAAVAVMLAAAAHFRRHLILRERGDYHEGMERVRTDRARLIGQPSLEFANQNPGIAAEWRTYAACEAEIGAWHARLKEKYRHLARYPWLAMEPNPPKPENPLDFEDLHNVGIPGLP